MQNQSSKVSILKKYTDTISKIANYGKKPEDPNEIKYAGFGLRMLASVIDSLLSIILMIPVFQIFYKIIGPNEVQQLIATGALKAEDLTQEQVADFITRQFASFTLQNVVIAAVVIIFWIYRSATPGKIMLRMEIVDAKTAKQPSKKQLIIRYLAYMVSLLPLGMGFIWIYYDKKKQGWHDKIAGTVVIINKKKRNILAD